MEVSVLIISGLALIVIGWIGQIIKIIVSKELTISGLLLVPYAIGCVLLAVGSYITGDWMGVALNTTCALLPLVIVIIVLRR